MKPVNPVSEKDRAEAKRLHDTITNRFFPSVLDVEEIAHTLADARSEGYVAGVEDAARVARGKECFFMGDGDLFAAAILEDLLGPKKEGGG